MRNVLNSPVGNGSNGQDVIETDRMASRTSSSVTSSNSLNLLSQFSLIGTDTGGMEDDCRLSLNVFILSLKNFAKESARSLGLSWSGRFLVDFGQVNLLTTRTKDRADQHSLPHHAHWCDSQTLTRQEASCNYHIALCNAPCQL